MKHNDNDKDLDIRMLMPCEFDKRPVAPLNYMQWLFNTAGYNDLVIRFLDNEKIGFEDFDSFSYIKYNKQSFIRYNIKKDVFYIWKNEGTIITKVSELVNYCKEKGIRILLEKPKNCTYGAI